MLLSLVLLALYLAIFLPAFVIFVVGLRSLVRTDGHRALRPMGDDPDANI